MTRYEILPDVQRALLPELRPARRLGFALYGGTAIALQLGHRESIDFDFFSSAKLDEELLVENLPFLASATTLQREPETWTLQTFPAKDGRPVKLSFFGDLGFGRVGRPVPSDDGTLIMASLDDLLGHKLKVLLQRVEAKDYQDISAMLRAGMSLERGLGAASALFANFPPADAVRAMTYFEGGDLGRLGREDRVILTTAAASVGPAIDVPIIAKDLHGGA